LAQLCEVLDDRPQFHAHGLGFLRRLFLLCHALFSGLFRRFASPLLLFFGPVLLCFFGSVLAFLSFLPRLRFGLFAPFFLFCSGFFPCLFRPLFSALALLFGFSLPPFLLRLTSFFTVLVYHFMGVARCVFVNKNSGQ
jgi:hypothetical protein